MATTRITATRRGSDGLAYATQQGKPHNDIANVDKRVLMLGAVNCSIVNFKSQMQAVWNANNTKRDNKIELYRITQSFSTDELDVNNPDDIVKCNQIGVETAQRLYPDKLVVVATQADGKGGKLHNHIDICSPGFENGKALRGERTNQGHIAYISDKVCNDYGVSKPDKLPDIKPDQLRTKSGTVINKNKQQIARNGKDSFLAVLQKKLQLSITDTQSVSFDSFKKVAESNGIDVKIRKNKRGKVNGLSYQLKNGSHKRPVRASKLGTKYEAGFISSLFEKHLERQRKQQIESQRFLTRMNLLRKKEEAESKAKSKQKRDDLEL